MIAVVVAIAAPLVVTRLDLSALRDADRPASATESAAVDDRATVASTVRADRVVVAVVMTSVPLLGALTLRRPRSSTVPSVPRPHALLVAGGGLRAPPSSAFV
jgi:hypothetical protein